MDGLVTWLRAQLDEDERVACSTDGQRWIVGTPTCPATARSGARDPA